MKHRRRFAGAAALALALAPWPAALADERALRDADDTAGKLDIQSAAAAHSPDGRLRHTIETYDPWTGAELRSRAPGPPGGLCIDIWTARRPSTGPPDYLVCANAAARGDGIQAWVTRVSLRPGRTGRTTAAIASRPSPRGLILRFSQRQIGRPARYYWRAETLYRGEGCDTAQGCADTAPSLARVTPHILRRSRARD